MLCELTEGMCALIHNKFCIQSCMRVHLGLSHEVWSLWLGVIMGPAEWQTSVFSKSYWREENTWTENNEHQKVKDLFKKKKFSVQCWRKREGKKVKECKNKRARINQSGKWADVERTRGRVKKNYSSAHKVLESTRDVGGSTVGGCVRRRIHTHAHTHTHKHTHTRSDAC